ncbi:MAG TPA: hypothetical protein VK550_02880 [Polyangiaceae bacterium]|nr:hypothetical protein [Polyangiaceae bacterium]
MVRPAATSPLAFIFLATTAVVSAACFDTSSSITTADYPTRLTADPALFLGSLRCGAPELERYVVTLFDVSVRETRDVPVTSSGPVACHDLVSFGEPRVISTHYYTATIDGYDREVIADPDSDITVTGRPKMLDSSSREEISPIWTTTCGEVPPPAPEQDAEAVEDGPPAYNQLRFPTQVLGKTEVILHGCRPLAALTPDAGPDDDSGADRDASTDAQPPLDTSDVAEPDGGAPSDDASGEDAEAGEGDANEGGLRRRAR